MVVNNPHFADPVSGEILWRVVDLTEKLSKLPELAALAKPLGFSQKEAAATALWALSIMWVSPNEVHRQFYVALRNRASSKHYQRTWTWAENEKPRLTALNTLCEGELDDPGVWPLVMDGALAYLRYLKEIIYG